MLVPGPADIPGVPVVLGLLVIVVAGQIVLNRNQEGNLITSRTPDDLPAFLRTIVAACQERSEAAMVSERGHHAG